MFARHSQGAYHVEVVAQRTQSHAHSLQEILIPFAAGVSQLWQFHEHESLLATQTQISASHALFQSEQWQGCLGARWRGNGYGVQHEKECFPEQYHLAWALSPCASLLFQSQATAAQLEVGCESWGAPQREALLLWWGRCHAKHVLGKNRAVEVFLGISAEQARAQIGYLTTF